jgi:hypothetical protein
MATRYSNTSWYKNSTGYFQQIPLLTAVLNELYYQDGTDPEIFGRIDCWIKLKPAQFSLIKYWDKKIM